MSTVNMFPNDKGPDSVVVPDSDDLTLWPWFSNYNFHGITAEMCADWITVFAGLKTTMNLFVEALSLDIAEANGMSAKRLRAKQKVLGAYATHYHEMGKALSRQLTAITEEMKARIYG